MIHVTADDANGQFSSTQERYYAVSEQRVENDDRMWYIPVNYATETEHDFDNLTISAYFLNLSPGAVLKVPYPAEFNSSQWFIFNKQQIGYYRVNYDTENWQKIAALLNSDNFHQIHVLNRAQLIDDALTFAYDGYLDYTIAFDILNYLNRETDYIPWRAAVTNLDKIDYILKGRVLQPNYRTYIKQLARRMYVKYGLEEKASDSLMDKFARETAIDWTCRMGDARCLADTYEYVKKMAFEGYEAPDSLEIVYICHGLKGLNKHDEFFALWSKMQKSEDQAQRLRILDGIMCATDPKVLHDLIETTLVNSAETYYRTHERSRIINNVFVRSDVGLSVTVDILSNYFAEFSSM